MKNKPTFLNHLAGLREAPVSCWSGISDRSLSGVEIVGQTLRKADCLAQVEVLWRGMRNTCSSTGGQLPLYALPFDRQSPEFRGYVAALVDQSRKTTMQIESMVNYNCQDPNATSFSRGGVVGAWFE